MSTVNGSSLIEPQGEATTHIYIHITSHRITFTHKTHRVGCTTVDMPYHMFFGPVKFQSKHFHKQIQQSVASVDCRGIPLLQQLSCALPNPEALHPTEEL